MSRRLGLLNRTWIEKQSPISRDRSTSKLKYLWQAWDEDSSVRQVLSQRIKSLTFASYFDREKTLHTLAKELAKELSEHREIDWKILVQGNGQEVIMITPEESKNSLEINVNTVLDRILKVSESVEHKI